MASVSDTTLSFFKKATPEQWRFVLSIYKDAVQLKADLRTKKGGPEEFIKLDTWYQEQLPKTIHSRNELLLSHEELVKIMKWKLMRSKFKPQLLDLVKINTESSVKSLTRRAFKRMPNMAAALQALTGLKGIGPATASAILAAAFPEHAPYMADEVMLSTPGVEATDYTSAEYLNYAHHIKTFADELATKDPQGEWTAHKIEMAMWAHYVARSMKPQLLESLPGAVGRLPTDEASQDASSNGEATSTTTNEANGSGANGDHAHDRINGPDTPDWTPDETRSSMAAEESLSADSSNASGDVTSSTMTSAVTLQAAAGVAGDDSCSSSAPDSAPSNGKRPLEGSSIPDSAPANGKRPLEGADSEENEGEAKKLKSDSEDDNSQSSVQKAPESTEAIAPSEEASAATV